MDLHDPTRDARGAPAAAAHGAGSRLSREVWIILLTLAVDAVGLGVATPVLPDLLHAVGERPAHVPVMLGSLITCFYFMQFVFGPIVGALSDAWGRRPILLIALGGGVIGDMTGFAAACYMRGVPFIQVPTTLLSQVDSSVGGKTGINHPLGKNMIGAFYQPQAVIADIGALSTLPDRELAAGVAEIVKTGAIADAAFFDWIEANVGALTRRDPDALAHAVKRSCEIKAGVVAADEREGGLRAILNFGHTFGHAIEAGLGYGEWLHGEAVGCGMVMAADLSVRTGHLDEASRARVCRLVAAAPQPRAGAGRGRGRRPSAAAFASTAAAASASFRCGVWGAFMLAPRP